MNIAEKLEAVADAVFEAGKKAQYDEFWKTLQANGASKSYQYAFGGRLWSDATFKPAYPLNGTSYYRCFAESGIKNIVQTINAEKCTGSTSLQNMFYNADIVTIKEMKVSENSTFDSTTFKGCTELTTINFTGTIKKNISFVDCSSLNDESIENIKDHLYDFPANESTETRTITFHSTIKTKLYNSGKIAEFTGKGWTVS